ncbi:MAG: hypothetical protein DHS20C12_30310 [Pseudohongiella sp.]|nr:MAG: hypothetical protein DHS20C12_30310 [Pseudohongiella sp.]
MFEPKAHCAASGARLAIIGVDTRAGAASGASVSLAMELKLGADGL